jgi:hypothetical protein
VNIYRSGILDTIEICGVLTEFELYIMYYLSLFVEIYYYEKRDDSILFFRNKVQASTIMFTQNIL